MVAKARLCFTNLLKHIFDKVIERGGFRSREFDLSDLCVIANMNDCSTK
jgi:hypothetical protein